MNCIEVQEKIYLYNEIGATERKQVDEHLHMCSSCRKIAEQVEAMNRLLSRQRSSTPSMSNHARMTRNIMDKVEALEKTRFGSSTMLPPYFFLNVLRNAMAVFSIFLVALFSIESFSGEGIVGAGGQEAASSTEQKTELNMASFHSAFLASNKSEDLSPTTFSRCVAICLQLDKERCEACTNNFVKQ